MGTKYTTIAASGYNQSPPPDDGSTVSTNLEKWSDVKTKIGDPVKTLADAINASLVAFTDFSGRVSSANETTLAADHMKTIECTTTQTESLLDATTAGAGYIVGFKNTGTGVVTIALQTAGNTLNGTANGTATIPANESKVFKVNSGATGYYSLHFRGNLTDVLNEAMGASIASAATINLTTATGNLVHVTGTTTITAVTLGAGMRRRVIFDGVLTLTHSATTNNLPTAANITTAAGDRAEYWSDGTTVYCTDYTRANGTALSQDGLGYNQNWQNLTASRVLSTNYTNSTGRPISVSYWPTSTTSSIVTGVVGGVTVSYSNYNDASQGSQIPISFIVPNGAVYSIASSTVIGTWVELR